MEIRTVLLIILATLVALAIVFYQYFYKHRKRGSQNTILATLRFISIFTALLLLINPKFTKRELFLEKTSLVLLLDGSSSMNSTADTNLVPNIINSLAENPDLTERFKVQPYIFGSEVSSLDSIVFDRKNTDISKAVSNVEEILINTPKTIVLLSDGNQTLGRDYEFLKLDENTDIYPIVIGDTTQFEDVSIGLINTNTYAFLKNKFPIEAQIRYKGKNSVSKRVVVAMDGKAVHREIVSLDPVKNSMTVNALIQTESVGIKSIKISVEALENEKNQSNNLRETAIEVIDEKTNVAIISDLLHPDIGALKKSIESNEQRFVTLLKPTASAAEYQEMDLLILYQPNRRFKNVYDHIFKTNGNSFTITGTKTDWGFLNQVQNGFFLENLNQSEEIIPVLNNAFNVFGLGNFSVTDFPPLLGRLGDIEINKSTATILSQRIRGVDLDKPLFSILNEGNRREAVLFGENLWKWRAQSYRNTQSFSDFDDFMSKLMVYLASNNQRSRLELDFDFIFEDASRAQIRASYFDESYAFDPNANITIAVKGKENEFTREAPMLLKGSFYETDLSDLQAGQYDFQVTAENENLKRLGSFKIMDFNPEKQFVSSNHTKLKSLVDNNNGELYFPNEVDILVDHLAKSQQYVPIQKSKQNVVSLIDFRLLLGLMVLSLTLEWFIRKYNGLI